MFDRIAGVYDRMNGTMTAGLDRRWRERAADRTELRPGERALDVCCGTGDLALALGSRVGSDGSVTGCDFSEPMLAIARRKAEAAAGDREAYTYLPQSVKRFPDPHRLAELVASAGVERIRYLVLAGGIIAIHSGLK